MFTEALLIIAKQRENPHVRDTAGSSLGHRRAWGSDVFRDTGEPGDAVLRERRKPDTKGHVLLGAVPSRKDKATNESGGGRGWRKKGSDR